MPLVLGSAFAPRVVEVREPEPPTVENLQTEMLLAALARLHDALAQMPAPVVNVAEPDLTNIVQAVTQLNGPATAGEIAAAVRAELDGTEQPAIEPVLKEMLEALKKLDFRLKGVGSSSGGGGTLTTRITNEPNTSLETREAVQDTRYEWQTVNAESRPLYIGTALPATATTRPTWTIQKYTYVGGDLSLVETRTGAWDSRASLF